MKRTDEELAEIVRIAWVAWAKEQPITKPSWLVPYEDLSEHDKEADRRIASAIATAVREERAEEVRVLREALTEVQTHLGAIEAIIKTAIELKPGTCILTDKYDGICPHCESDLLWLRHELKAHTEYSDSIDKALEGK